MPTAMVVPGVRAAWVGWAVMAARTSAAMGLPVAVVGLVVRLVLVVQLVWADAVDLPVRRAAVGMAALAGMAARGLTRAVLRRGCRVRSAVKAVLVVRAEPVAARHWVG